ncbi:MULTISPECIES: hypothetical protein [Bacillus]|uniref:hypothetical protein n=1 Tax=Bacillus TaxID=1386 RepID=UPI001C5802EC|nr:MULTISPECIES: hypothetical protein [Bacillus]MEC1666385.1 hypothetical protein [Bacillus mojavensis]QXW84068.1 hypothetical protein KXZ66_22205 [Bacillus sp. LJBS17]CAI6330046.1 hypothetical protein NRS6190_21395 [Bacillus subtilis]
MYMVQTLYDLENCGIGSEVQLYTNPNTAIQHAIEAKNKHILEFHMDEEPEVYEPFVKYEIYSIIVQNDENFWSVTVKEINLY